MKDTISLAHCDPDGRLPLEDAEVRYLPALFEPGQCQRLLARLAETLEWRQHQVRIAGRRIPSPRLSCWYGDPGIRYQYSGIALEAAGWQDDLTEIRERVEAAAHTTFNSVLGNYYRGGDDSMGWHSDAEPELGRCPTIASVSFGAVRRFSMRHRRRADVPSVRLDLEDGSLLLMAGPTQHHWRHALAKTRRATGPRINLTFRRIVATRPGPRVAARSPLAS